MKKDLDFNLYKFVNGNGPLLITGPVASGKSTFANRFANKHNFKFISTDDLSDEYIYVKNGVITGESLEKLYDRMEHIIKNEQFCILEGLAITSMYCDLKRAGESVDFILEKPMVILHQSLYVTIIRHWCRDGVNFKSIKDIVAAQNEYKEFRKDVIKFNQ